MTNLCPSPKHSNFDDPVEIGTCLANPMEVYERNCRLVGIVHNPDREIHRYVLRQFKDGDGAFPTGKYFTTSIIGLAPHLLEERERNA